MRDRIAIGATGLAALVVSLFIVTGPVNLTFNQTADIIGTTPADYLYEWKAASIDQTADECYSDWNLGITPPDVPGGAQTIRNGVWVGGGYAKLAAISDVYRCDTVNRRVYVIARDDSAWIWTSNTPEVPGFWTPQSLPAENVAPIPLVRQVPDPQCEDTGQTQGDKPIWECRAPFEDEIALVPTANNVQLFVRSRFNEIVSPWSQAYSIGVLFTPQNVRLEAREP